VRGCTANRRSIDRCRTGEFKILSSETCGLVEHGILLLLLENVAGHVRSCRPINLLYSSRIVKDRGEKIVDVLRSVSVVDLIINFLDLSSSAWLDRRGGVASSTATLRSDR
jgi:hypothetical protein